MNISRNLLAALVGTLLVPSAWGQSYDISTWRGLFAPAGTSSEIVHRLSANMAKIVTLPDIRERFAALGIEPAANTPEQFSLLVKAEVGKFARLAKAAGIKPE